jgi:DNA-binding transcriptional regulator YhcF (GntR family)
LVNHKEEKFLIGSDIFVCGRGETIRSLDTLARRWGCNKSKVRRFLKLLEKDQMIDTKSERKATRLKVLKYDEYQTERNANETQMKRKRNANETQMTLNKNEKNEKKEDYLHNLHIYIANGEFEKIQKLKKQLSFDQCENLVNAFGEENVKDVLLQMENFKDLEKKYQSVFLTATNWLKRKQNESTSKTTGSRIDAIRSF